MMERNSNLSVLIILSTLLIAFEASSQAQYAGGTGEPNDPYLIATREQFLAADFSQAGIHYRLCCNIDLDRGIYWYRQRVVRAHLDGAGFEIQSAMLIDTGGFFATIESEGTVANLTLADLDFGFTNWNEGEARGWAGGMAARNYGAITNCGVTGWIVARAPLSVGGIVGYNRGLVANCYFDGWVSTDWENRDTDGFIDADPFYGGGLVSRNAGTVVNSYARGVVAGTEGLGGLVGSNEGTIRNCYSWGMVIGGVGSGGLVATNVGSLQRCYTISYVTGAMRGGLVGMAGSYSGTVSDCLWDINITACPTSGAGVGVDGLGWAGSRYCSYNGWAGDPNWVVHPGFGDPDNYPRLAWEGAGGEIVPETAFLWGGAAGTGTESDPYVIEYPTQLYELGAASAFWDAHFVLAADLNMLSAFDYSPIGVGRGSSFSGTFDGNGHVIRNVRIEPGLDFDRATLWNTGVFGYVTGEVRNLRVEDIRLESGANSQCVGLLAGTSEGLIDNCSATGSIRVGEGSRFIGELIGYSNGEVTNCEAKATIEAGEGSTEIGGLVGRSPR